MFLMQLVESYGESRDISSVSVGHLRKAVAALNRFVGYPVKVDELSAELVNRWISGRLAQGLARITIARQRGAILTLAREAERQGLIAAFGKTRLVRVPPSVPRAWLPDEFARLLAATDRLEGALPCGVPRRLMFRAFALAGYYTGLRPGDLLRLPAREMLSGSLTIVQAKTGVPITIELPSDALAAVLATHPERRERLFPISRKSLVRWAKWVRREANLPGSAKWLRRTGATRCEQVQPGSAMSYLGHRTPGLAYKHYVDQRQLQQQRPIPPPPKIA